MSDDYSGGYNAYQGGNDLPSFTPTITSLDNPSFGEGALSALSNLVNTDVGSQSVGSVMADSPQMQQLSAPEAPQYTPSDQKALDRMIGSAETSKPETSMLSTAGKALGLYDKNGDLDISKIMKLGLGVASFASGVASKGKQAGVQSASQLQGQLAQNANNSWTPQQQGWVNSAFYNPRAPRTLRSAADMPSAVAAGHGYADGGTILRPGGRNIFDVTRRRQEQEAGLQDYTPQQMQQGTMSRAEVPRQNISSLLTSLPALFKSLGLADDSQQQQQPMQQQPMQQPQQPMARPGFAEGGRIGWPPHYAAGGDMGDMGGDMGGPMSMQSDDTANQTGFLGLVTGEGGGQDDLVDAKLSPGEYVFDAETVSMLGDGSNEEGAKKLDAWREQLRASKRDTPNNDIPDPAGHPDQYMQGDDQ